MTDMTTPAYLSTDEVARMLSCSRDTILRAVRRGDLPAIRYGRMVKVERAGLDAFLARYTVQADKFGAQRRRRRST